MFKTDLLHISSINSTLLFRFVYEISRINKSLFIFIDINVIFLSELLFLQPVLEKYITINTETT